jgi:glycosyltransferase involved in cell wall biosynthesis
LKDEGARFELTLAGRERASEFTWEKTAEATLELYRRVLLGKGKRIRKPL